jgi:hypothetical protein
VTDTLEQLLADLRAAEKGNNALDCRLAVALFRPDDTVTAARLNNAGTKVIYKLQSGKESTGLPCDLTTRIGDALDLFTAVLPGWWLQHLGQCIGGWRCRIERQGLSIPQSTSPLRGPTAPLALCAAIVEAKIAEAGQ